MPSQILLICDPVYHPSVILTKAGIQGHPVCVAGHIAIRAWIPAFAGMTG